ncbi:Uma2 family endonuclease [Salinibacter grassmerensis]|uniref:Uma2 family endonuclease n=1 Tax=Salinibacter grassmerensis TaxID=3040353 RepID=UPI0021E73901|nr:Uma2 family endonuclease [Salinibacter grassmerensis]
MPTTTTPAQHQKRWQEIVGDPLLSDLPYKVETNHRGQIVLSPHQFSHSQLQRTIQKKLDAVLTGGEVFPECPITTRKGVRRADVTWASESKIREMERAGDPPTTAPEICIEVMSESNDWDEMEEKRKLYREAGAEETWVVDEGEIRFFGQEEMEQSAVAPKFPSRVAS